MPVTIPESAKLPGPLRRFGALVYDTLGVISLWLIGSFPPVVVLNGKEITLDDGFIYFLFLAYVLALGIGYFVISWRLKHCTLGMKAWRLELVNLNEGGFTWGQLIRRAVAAVPAWLLLGIGIIWQYYSPSRQTWQDLASRTRVVILKKDKR